MDAILEPIGEFWNGFISNPIVVAAVQLSIIYIVLLWLGTSYWAFRDMQARTENPILPYFASEAEMNAYLADTDKVTAAIRDHIWRLAGATVPGPATTTASEGVGNAPAAGVAAGAAGGR